MMPDAILEANMIKEFRAMVDDHQVEDAELRRFLRARNHDFKQAADMFRQSREWRKAVKFEDAPMYEIPDIVNENFPFYIDGLDKDGRMAMYFPVGAWAVRKMIGEGYKEEMERKIYQVMANVCKILDTSEHETFVIVIDLAELTYWKIAHYETVQMVLKVFREYEQNFPERLKQALVINAPWVLNCIFPLIKPLLTGKTLQKVQIFDSNPSKYLSVLHEMIPKNTMPSRLGENLDKIDYN